MDKMDNPNNEIKGNWRRAEEVRRHLVWRSWLPWWFFPQNNLWLYDHISRLPEIPWWEEGEHLDPHWHWRLLSCHMIQFLFCRYLRHLLSQNNSVQLTETTFLLKINCGEMSLKMWPINLVSKAKPIPAENLLGGLPQNFYQKLSTTINNNQNILPLSQNPPPAFHSCRQH